MPQITFIFIFAISTLGYILFFVSQYGWKVEIAPLSVISAQIVILYIAGLLNFMAFAAYAVCVTGFLLLIYTFWINRQCLPGFFSKVLTPGFFLFWFFFFLFGLSTRGLMFTYWDEFSHWGLAFKLYSLTNQLPGRESAIMFSDYLPGTALYEYYVAKIVGYREGSAYFAHNLMMVASLITLLSVIKWKQWYQGMIGFVTALLLLYLFRYQFNSLFVDALLSLLFCAGVVSCMIYKDTGFASVIPTIVISTVITLTKEVGFLFAITVGFVFIIQSFQFVDLQQFFRSGSHSLQRISFKSKPIELPSWRLFFKYFIVLAIPLIFYVSWDIHIRSLEIARHFRSNTNPTNIFGSFSSTASERDRTTISAFTEAIDQQEIGFSTLSVKKILGLYGVALLLGYFLLSKDKLAQQAVFIKTHLLILLCVIFYIIGLLVMYLYNFPETEGLNLPSFERYLGTPLLGWGLIIYTAFLSFPQNASNAPKTFRNARLIGLFVLMLFLFVQVPLSSYIKPQVVPQIRKEIKTIVRQYVSKMDPQSNVYLIWQNNRSQFNFFVLRYEIAPFDSQHKNWSLGRPYSPDDTWTIDISPSDWFSTLIDENYDYVFIYRSDERFWETYGSLFKGYDGADAPQLFQVTDDHLTRIE